jgi:hypothetical protein
MNKVLFATVAALTLAGCGTAPSLTAPQTNAASFEAAGKHSQPAAPRQGLFDRLVGMVSVPEHWDKPAVDFEFGTQGLIFSDAVRKQPFITLNGKDYDADGYNIIAAEDGVLYVGRRDAQGHELKDSFYVLGTWQKPSELKVGMFRQKVEIKLPEHTFKVNRPFNPMAHITFNLDLKQPLKVADKAPERWYIKK